MKKASILLADNHEILLEATSEYLEESGYHVVRAANPVEARERIENEHLHLAVLDLRLFDDHNPEDKSGLRLAQSMAPSLPKLIWTRFTNDFSVVVEALRAEVGELPPAVDFIKKEDKIGGLMEAIERALEQHVRINEELVVHWETTLSFLQLAMIVDPATPERHLARSAEFKDLFGKLFFDSMQITIGQMLTQDGKRVIVPVYAYDETGFEQQFIVSCGCRTAVLEENKQFKSIPQPIFIKAIGERNMVETAHYAAIAYPFMGEKLEETIPLKLYFQCFSNARMVALIEHLYWDNLGKWYQRGRSKNETISLYDFFSQWLALSEEKLADGALWQAKAESICNKILAIGIGEIQYSPSKLSVKRRGGGEPIDYPNPLRDLKLAALAGGGNVQWGVAHGKVTVETILVDPLDNTWLIDFAHVGRAPLLCDFVTLETAVKLTLFNTLDFDTKHLVEKRLCEATSLNATICREGLPETAVNMVNLVEKIRHLADELAGCSLQAYFGGLFFCAVNQLDRFEPATLYNRRLFMPHAHALVSAALLATVLLDDAKNSSVEMLRIEDNLYIDTNTLEVWVEGQQVELTPQDFEILNYLYVNADRVCSREEVYLNVLSDGADKYDPIIDDGRLNSAMSRLRHKIGEASDHQYVTTVRGRGYRLVLPTV